VSGSEIYVKETFKKETNLLQSGLFMQNLSQGTYSILVAKDGFWPWLKDLNVKEGLVTEARAFLIPQSPQGKLILKGPFSAMWASSYNKILLLEKTKGVDKKIIFYLPDTDTFLTENSTTTANLLYFENGISKIDWQDGAVILIGAAGKQTVRVEFNFSDQTVSAFPEKTDATLTNNKYERFTAQKNQRLWWDNKTNKIWIEWLADNESMPYYICDAKPCGARNYFIAAFDSPVKNADFFPGRKDLLVAAVKNSVFALEIDGRSGRLSRPIYKGKNPTFAVFATEKKVYILDEGSLSSVSLE